MAHEIRWEGGAPDELFRLRIYDQRRIVAEVEKHLVDAPTVAARQRKPMLGLVPSFFHIPPIWELRVGDFRVFYDVDEEAQVVYVRAVRRKLPEQATEDIV